MKSQREIAEELLGVAISPEGFAPCPGASLHKSPTAANHFRIWFDPAGHELPHEHCFHQSCQAARDEFMSKLYRAIRANSRGEAIDIKPHRRPLPPPPPTQRPAAAAIDRARVAAIAQHCHVEPLSWLRVKSPVLIPPEPWRQSELLIDSLFAPGERILIFTRFCSQGQFLRVAGAENYRLGVQGSRAVLSPRLPAGGECGVWYLCSPVTGLWHPNPNKRDGQGNLLAGRRHEACCTRFPYLVIESDEVDPKTWLKILLQLNDPVVAIYTSGGRSVHALIRVDAQTKAQFDATRFKYVTRLAPIGADAAAMSAVRLTRLPGCLRYGTTNREGNYLPYSTPRRQELLYLNPGADGTPILDL